MVNWTIIIDTLMENGYEFDEIFEKFSLEQMLEEYARLRGELNG